MKTNKVIIITGGSDGLGKATSKQLNAKNKVIILSKDEKKLREAAKEIGCEYQICDVTDFKMVKGVVEKTIEKFEKVDVLINNAGVWLALDLVDNSYKKITNCIDVNINGTIHMIKAILPNMYKQKKV